jgi:hypothetical protein
MGQNQAQYSDIVSSFRPYTIATIGEMGSKSLFPSSRGENKDQSCQGPKDSFEKNDSGVAGVDVCTLL